MQSTAPLTAPRTAHRPRPTAHSGAFTLTEVMIALALVSFLLIGISRIFALTSTTIGTGQAFNAVLRTQRAVGQTMSADFLGVGPSLSNPIAGSGMTPLVNRSDPSSGAPYLTICNFRVAAYLDAAAMAADADAPADTTTPLTAAQKRARSLLIRGIDLNNDGTTVGSSILSGGETTPLYWYGDRNFRCDTIGFFTHGSFHSQTGSNGRLIDNVTSSDALTWYGHLRIFNGDAASEYLSAANGPPGDWQTSGGQANRNNRFAEDFRLGRFQTLLVEPTDHDGIPGTASPAGNLQDFNTVTLDGDPSQPVYFAKRNWWDPTFRVFTGSPPPRPTLTPINLSSAVQFFVKADGKNETVCVPNASGVETYNTAGLTQYSMSMCRCDVAGVGLPQLRARAKFIEQLDADPATAPTPAQPRWWETLPINWVDRYYVNPFPARTSSASVSRRQQLLADAASQFIVEFAGDFVTQPNQSSGNVTAAVPDGVLDYVVVNGTRMTKWYGMPRDVDVDGVIAGSGNTRFTSADVTPVRDFAGLAAGISFPFEKAWPATAANYGTVVAEPTARDNGKSSNGSPDDTAYVCAWGPTEFEGATPVTVNGQSTNAYAVPQLIRVLVELRDVSGKLKEPQVQEFVYPVPIRK